MDKHIKRFDEISENVSKSDKKKIITKALEKRLKNKAKNTFVRAAKEKPETKNLKVGQEYEYKDGRKVKVMQLAADRERAEVIIGKTNPFWVNYSDLS